MQQKEHIPNRNIESVEERIVYAEERVSLLAIIEAREKMSIMAPKPPVEIHQPQKLTLVVQENEAEPSSSPADLFVDDPRELRVVYQAEGYIDEVTDQDSESSPLQTVHMSSPLRIFKDEVQAKTETETISVQHSNQFQIVPEVNIDTDMNYLETEMESEMCEPALYMLDSPIEDKQQALVDAEPAAPVTFEQIMDEGPLALKDVTTVEPYIESARQFSDILKAYIVEIADNDTQEQALAIYDEMATLAEQLFRVENDEYCDESVVEMVELQLYEATRQLLVCLGVEASEDTVAQYVTLFVENKWYSITSQEGGATTEDPFRERKLPDGTCIKVSYKGQLIYYRELGKHAVSFFVAQPALVP